MHRTADPSSAEMLLKTTIAVNRLGVYRTVVRCNNNNSTEDFVNLDENVNILPKLITNLQKHEPPRFVTKSRMRTICGREIDLGRQYFVKQDSQKLLTWDKTLCSDRQFS